MDLRTNLPEPAWRIDRMRTIVSSVSFGIVVFLFIFIEFGDRGYHFKADHSSTAALDGKGSYDLVKLNHLTRCVGFIRSRYVDPERIAPRRMIVAALERVQEELADMLVQADDQKDPQLIRVKVGDRLRDFDISRVTDLYEMNWKLIDVFEFVQGSLQHAAPLHRIEYMAIEGILSTLDPHSVFLNPDTYRQMKLGTSGKFGGLGIVIWTREGHLTIVSVMPDTPAARAKLKANDRIIQIEAESTINMSLGEVVKRLRGRPGTKVTIWVLRKGWDKPRMYTLVRSNIKVDSVSSRALGHGIGYVKLKSFQEQTRADLVTAIKQLDKKVGGLRGLVLDMRDNPGGLLDQAMEVSDVFLKQGTIVKIVAARGVVRQKRGSGPNSDADFDMPLVVLVNGGSASASEIVAGALKNNDRAVVIGRRTFGKGSVQVLYELKSCGADSKQICALKLTTSKYLTPGDRSIQNIGITPDILTIPVRINRENPQFLSWESRENREADLKLHLAGETAGLPERPGARIRFLAHSPAGGPNADKGRDFEVVFAERFLRRIRVPSRADALKRSSPIVQQIAQVEQRRIEKALGKLGIEWTRAPAELAGRPVAKVDLSTNRPSSRVSAGEKIQIKVSVRNVGTAPLYQLRAITKSRNRLFDGRELLFGRIDPGARKHWRVPIVVPRSALTRYDNVEVRFVEGKGQFISSASVGIHLQALPRPLLGYSYQVTDEEGNGDGLPQKGEKLSIKLWVHNYGPGEAVEALATLKNLSGERVFVSRGRAKLGMIARGVHVTAGFALKVRDGWQGDSIELLLGMTDPVVGEQFQDRLTIPLYPSRSGPKPMFKVARIQKRADVMAGPDTGQQRVGRLSSETLVLVTGYLPGWYKISLANSGIGWIRASRAKLLSLLSKPSAPTPDLTIGHAPPRINLAHELPTRTRRVGVRVRGEVKLPGKSAAGLKDIMVYVGRRKVYFAAPTQDRRDTIRFDFVAPLEAGSNAVRIIARTNEHLRTVRRFVVYREGDGGRGG